LANSNFLGKGMNMTSCDIKGDVNITVLAGDKQIYTTKEIP